MSSLRQVDGVAILDWTSGPEVPQLASDIKTLLEAGSVQQVLINMQPCQGLRADSLETLTEALTVCRERSCAVGMFALSDSLLRLVDVTGIADMLPPLMGDDEVTAVANIQNGGGDGVRAPGEDTAQLEFEIDLDPELAATAPTARFDPAQLATMAAAPGAGSAPRAAPAQQRDEDLLMVCWGDLTATGATLGGAGAEAIMAAVAEEPTMRFSSAEEGVIDLGDVVPAKAPAQPRQGHGYRTEKLPVFSLDSSDDADEGWTATPATAQVEFASLGRGPGLAAEPPGVFSGPDAGDFSPVDTSFAQVSAPAAERVNDADETVMIQPGALEAALMQAGVSAATPAAAPPSRAPKPAAVEEDDETIMFQPGALDAALLAEVAKAAGPLTHMEPPRVEAPPLEPQLGPGNQSPEEAELRRFVHDHALSSPLHLQVLDRFLNAKDQALARSDLQLATGGPHESVLEIIDQLVQSRLVRRTRSARARGGTGYTFSTSPRTRATVVRLLRMWGDPGGRQRLTAWLGSGS